MRSDDRRGFALPAVIGALIIIGILVTAGFYMARQELRIGVASNHTNLALNIAQAGANEVMANWNGYQLGGILPWTDTTLTDTIADGIWTVNITNANDYVYFLTSTGEVTRGGDLWAGASRTIGLAAHILFADINPPAALTTRGKVKVTGTSTVQGSNYTPGPWAPYCTEVPPGNSPGIMVDDDGGGTNPDVDGSATLGGNPPAVEDSTIVDSTFTTFGNMDWDQLTTYAQLEGMDVTSVSSFNGIAPVVSGGLCDTSDLLNWGDTVPTNPCGSYFPLIYHSAPTGTMTIQSNSFGQGILLVESNLMMRGGFTFFGIVIVQGTFETGAGGATVYGAVMASNAADIQETVTGGGTIIYSRCAVTRAVLNNAALSRARPLEERSWVDLSSVFN